MRFSELKMSPTGISPKTLTERLRDLEKKEMTVRTVYAEAEIRVEYNLTKRGNEVVRLIVATCD